MSTESLSAESSTATESSTAAESSSAAEAGTPGVATAAGATALDRSVAEALDVFTALGDEQWSAPSACPGWTLHTVLAHLTTGVASIAGLLPPSEPAPPGLEFEAAIDVQARALAARPAGELLELLRTARPAAVGLFDTLSAELATHPVEMGTAGTYPLASIADALTFDFTCHLRWDVLAPRGPVQRALPAVDAGRLSASVRWLAAGIAQMTTSRFRDLLTDPLHIAITGPEAMTIRIQSHAQAVEATPDGPHASGPSAASGATPRATVRTSADAFILWSTGREPRQGRAELLGDAAYAEQVLAEFRVY
ncbi:conserved hypothetical protein [Frankia sp. AiPs1]|uniref:maleylpyruvate isomerase N-terminal domain-containing protein n=1 Tax=Frankia sp. AiPa1 TaxID=573492 RepID=UPI00202B4786|nr:maleylpyruvate isomerase N-terminal domain-containing protein [Frankia sp. AiPa1]MCL9758238.1 maleylpyruvate isomerase N-terminal domain-containing protein [Frankia sp. AiPa1]